MEGGAGAELDERHSFQHRSMSSGESWVLVSRWPIQLRPMVVSEAYRLLLGVTPVIVALPGETAMGRRSSFSIVLAILFFAQLYYKNREQVWSREEGRRAIEQQGQQLREHNNSAGKRLCAAAVRGAQSPVLEGSYTPAQ